MKIGSVQLALAFGNAKTRQLQPPSGRKKKTKPTSIMLFYKSRHVSTLQKQAVFSGDPFPIAAGIASPHHALHLASPSLTFSSAFSMNKLLGNSLQQTQSIQRSATRGGENGGGEGGRARGRREGRGYSHTRYVNSVLNAISPGHKGSTPGSSDLQCAHPGCNGEQRVRT